MPLDGPPAHAWDWLARQRFVWREARRRLVDEGYAAAVSLPSVAGRSDRAPRPATARRPAGDVPDWSADHPELVRTELIRQASSAGGASLGTGPDRHAQDPGPRRDYGALDTRAECIAALRVDYPHDPVLRRTVDAVVTDLVFLGRLDVPLHELGVRSAPRGMRWWWTRLTGRDADEGRSDLEVGDEPASSIPLQLRLVDVLAGYGDVTDA